VTLNTLSYNLKMSWRVIYGGSKGIRVVFKDKTFVDFENNHAQVYEIHNDKMKGDLRVGNWTGSKYLDASGKEHKTWVAIASFPADSYQYVMQIP